MSQRRPPVLVPAFPMDSFWPQSPPRVIRRGSHLICMVSHISGIEEHPIFYRDPRTDPRPEPKPKPPRPVVPRTKKTRREKRLLKFGEPFSVADGVAALLRAIKMV